MSVVRKTIFAAALMASGAAYAGTPGWSVSESSGPVFVHKPGVSKTSAVVRGAALSLGDIISTGKGGRAVIVRGGEYMTVAANTQVQLTEPKEGAFTQIVQSFGNIVFKIQKKTTPHFQVNTPYLAAVVKGTTFSVTVTPAGASVQVTEGLVQVQSLDGNISRFVSPGEIGMISAAAPGQLSVLGTPSAPSAAPTIVGPAPVAEPARAAESAQAPAETVTPTVSEVAEVRIASPIGEGNVNLAAQTGGIVSGNSSLTSAAVLDAVSTQTPAAEAVAPAQTVAVAETPVAPVVTEAPAPVVAEAPAAPVVTETPAPVVAEAPAAPVVTEVPAPVVAQAPAPVVAQPPAPVVAEAPAAVVAEAPAAVAAVVPAPVVAELPAAIVAEPPVAIISETPAAVVAAAPATLPPVVSEVASNVPSNLPAPAAAAETPAAIVAAPIAPVAETPAATPTLVAAAEPIVTLPPQAAAPAVAAKASVSPVVASPVASVANENDGNGKSGKNDYKSLSELLKALQSAANSASAGKKGS